MYIIDYHTHSHLSPDADFPLEEMAAAAVAAGLDELCITDHYDTLTLDGQRAAPYDWTPAEEQFLRVQESFRGKLTLRLGIEFGSGHLDDAALQAAPQTLDFVIGSPHNRSEALGGADFYCGPYDNYPVCRATLDDYFASMALLAPLPVYDVLGHVIYPLRYMVRDGQDVSLAPWMDRIGAIFKTTIQSGRGIEVNTYNGRTLSEWKPVLELYRSLGGEIVTTGSDAHFPENVAKGIREATALLKDCGFRYLTTYHARKPQFVKL